MNRCPLTYRTCGDDKYSQEGLKKLSRGLRKLDDFPFTPKEQVELAVRYASKLSIQGVQPKLSVKLNATKSIFEIVERSGTFILKPPHPIFPEMPQNEDLTMHLATTVSIEVPLHGLMYNIDGSLTYFIKRFDRLGKGKKLAVEDFSQLSGHSRETKYDSSMEKLVFIIEQYCTFPMLEKIKLFRLTVFNFLVGNEDMHLKNFSLIRRAEKVELSPAYDLLNSTIVLQTREELALPLKGKKNNLKRKELVDYYGYERLGLSRSLIEDELQRFQSMVNPWQELIQSSFLSPGMRESYLALIKERWRRLTD